MKKLSTILILTLSSICNTFAQDVENVKKTTPVTTNQNDSTKAKNTKVDYLSSGVFVDVFYGFPNLGYELMGDPKNYVSISNIGPLGGRIEFMTDSKNSLGVEFNYSETTIEEEVTVQNTKQAKITNLVRYRIMPRFCHHFRTNNKLDTYVHIGAGIAVFKNTEGINKNQTLPCVRAGVGIKYFIAKKSAVYIDFGIGGPFITTGLSLNLN